ncbi:MAG TPA: GGDEF domain-containing protein [Candidatus Eremiobacteraceae bacterium]|nr:GGDEF domain-containing protein [Candidatus Eremiobacteraceae bacterium]
MIVAQHLGWVFAGGVAATAVALFVLMRYHIDALALRAERAERRFDLLQHVVPSLTDVSAESTGAACARILERLNALVPADVLLCFFNDDGRLVLGAKSGAGYAGYLREGEAYDGATLVHWVRENAKAAIVGPTPVDILDVIDLSSDPETTKLGIGPVAGSRDRVWALAVPLSRDRGFGRQVEVVGVMYAERARSEPFTEDDVLTAITVGTLASDALQRARFADGIRRASNTDPLTKLLTPTAFRQRLRDEVDGRRFADPFASRDLALFFIDTDNFKAWNDTFGHAAGDKLLRALADIFGETARAYHGFAGRNGGDEFCIALLDRRKEEAVKLADAMRVRVEGNDFARQLGIGAADGTRVTLSIGVAHYPNDVAVDEPQAAGKLLEAADARMYEAKRGGRNRIAFNIGRPLPRKHSLPGEGPIPRF